MLQRLRILWAFAFMKGGEKDMAMVYVTLIIKGSRTFASVPNVLKEQVKRILVDLELEELAA